MVSSTASTMVTSVSLARAVEAQTTSKSLSVGNVSVLRVGLDIILVVLEEGPSSLVDFFRGGASGDSGSLGLRGGDGWSPERFGLAGRGDGHDL